MGDPEGELSSSSSHPDGGTGLQPESQLQDSPQGHGSQVQQVPQEQTNSDEQNGREQGQEEAGSLQEGKAGKNGLPGQDGVETLQDPLEENGQLKGPEVSSSLPDGGQIGDESIPKATTGEEHQLGGAKSPPETIPKPGTSSLGSGLEEKGDSDSSDSQDSEDPEAKGSHSGSPKKPGASDSTETDPSQEEEQDLRTEESGGGLGKGGQKGAVVSEVEHSSSGDLNQRDQLAQQTEVSGHGNGVSAPGVGVRTTEDSGEETLEHKSIDDEQEDNDDEDEEEEEEDDDDEEEDDDGKSQEGDDGQAGKQESQDVRGSKGGPQEDESGLPGSGGVDAVSVEQTTDQETAKLPPGPVPPVEPEVKVEVQQQESQVQGRDGQLPEVKGTNVDQGSPGAEKEVQRPQTSQGDNQGLKEQGPSKPAVEVSEPSTTEATLVTGIETRPTTTVTTSGGIQTTTQVTQSPVPQTQVTHSEVTQTQATQRTDGETESRTNAAVGQSSSQATGHQSKAPGPSEQTNVTSRNNTVTQPSGQQTSLRGSQLSTGVIKGLTMVVTKTKEKEEKIASKIKQKMVTEEEVFDLRCFLYKRNNPFKLRFYMFKGIYRLWRILQDMKFFIVMDHTLITDTLDQGVQDYLTRGLGMMNGILVRDNSDLVAMYSGFNKFYKGVVSRLNYMKEKENPEDIMKTIASISVIGYSTALRLEQESGSWDLVEVGSKEKNKDGKVVSYALLGFRIAMYLTKEIVDIIMENFFKYTDILGLEFGINTIISRGALMDVQTEDTLVYGTNEPRVTVDPYEEYEQLKPYLEYILEQKEASDGRGVGNGGHSSRSSSISRGAPSNRGGRASGRTGQEADGAASGSDELSEEEIRTKAWEGDPMAIKKVLMKSMFTAVPREIGPDTIEDYLRIFERPVTDLATAPSTDPEVDNDEFTNEYLATAGECHGPDLNNGAENSNIRYSASSTDPNIGAVDNGGHGTTATGKNRGTGRGRSTSRGRGRGRGKGRGGHCGSDKTAATGKNGHHAGASGTGAGGRTSTCVTRQIVDEDTRGVPGIDDSYKIDPMGPDADFERFMKKISAKDASMYGVNLLLGGVTIESVFGTSATGDISSTSAASVPTTTTSVTTSRTSVSKRVGDSGKPGVTSASAQGATTVTTSSTAGIGGITTSYAGSASVASSTTSVPTIVSTASVPTSSGTVTTSVSTTSGGTVTSSAVTSTATTVGGAKPKTVAPSTGSSIPGPSKSNRGRLGSTGTSINRTTQIQLGKGSTESTSTERSGLGPAGDGGTTSNKTTGQSRIAMQVKGRNATAASQDKDDDGESKETSKEGSTASDEVVTRVTTSQLCATGIRSREVVTGVASGEVVTRVIASHVGATRVETSDTTKIVKELTKPKDDANTHGVESTVYAGTEVDIVRGVTKKEQTMASGVEKTDAAEAGGDEGKSTEATNKPGRAVLPTNNGQTKSTIASAITKIPTRTMTSQNLITKSSSTAITGQTKGTSSHSRDNQNKSNSGQTRSGGGQTKGKKEEEGENEKTKGENEKQIEKIISQVDTEKTGEVVEKGIISG
ncbi:hypothetical protein MACJ_002240 [Theileria orientalis]|uniref:Uncharacterized protein n=1 Tax=Theileria orientalis TaxID=68886 RepID=A0A976QVD0_THEOR|nr:hypothetical protein MACJ_002240 [Theileria orientalis]